MLSICDLNVSYGVRRILHDITLTVERGEVVALIGPNGAGKSTLIRAISGVIPAESGSMSAQGEALAGLAPRARARRMAVVPQAGAMPPAFTAWETVLLGRTAHLNLLGQLSEQDATIARQALEKVDASDLAERPMGELSGGEQQRVLLARALAQAAPLMLMDEPTAHLDLQHQVGFMELIRSLAHGEQIAVLTALHDLNLAARYADRVVLLVAGKINAAGTPRQVLTGEKLSQAYHLPVQVMGHPYEDAPLVLPGVRSEKEGPISS